MNFANVTEWKIPVNGIQRDVKQVVNSLGTILWQKSQPVQLEHFYVQNITNNTETVTALKDTLYGSAPSRYLFISDDAQNWTSLGVITTNGITFTLAPGAKKYVCMGTASTRPHTGYPCSYGESRSNILRGFSKVGGDIISLNKENYASETTYPSNANYGYAELFRDNINLIDASELLLRPDTVYNDMFFCTFKGCTSLRFDPALPATTLAVGCYSGMFYGCTSLTTAPVLPATTLADSCYYAMFHECSSLTTAPVLPATTLANYCYASMFWRCTSLNYIKCMATDISATDCVDDWVYDVASSGTFTKAAGVTWPTGSDGIPEGWTVVEQ